MGYSHTRLYQLIRAGRGPKLTPISLSPLSSTQGRRETFVSWEDALEWLQARPDASRWSDLVRQLRIEWIMVHIRSGTPLPRPPQTPCRAPSNALGASFGSLRP
jgi:hypothetical protein